MEMIKIKNKDRRVIGILILVSAFLLFSLLSSSHISVADMGHQTCMSNNQCSPGTYCEKDPGDCEGEGECERKPFMCQPIWQPVCGCDGKTYPNACEAARRGINVKSERECPPGITECTSNSGCPLNSYCKKDLG